MLKRIIKRLIKGKSETDSGPSYIAYLKRKGVRVGDGTVVFDPKDISIDVSRPELLEIGENVFLHKGTVIMTHDWASWTFVNKYHEFIPSHSKVKIGNNVWLGENVTILKGVEIGDNTTIGDSVSISHAIIGNNVIINSGARIGESGFGILPTKTGLKYIKQLGRVIISDNVRIGANTTIDRGSINDTFIGKGTIIDNLVQIGHNVKIGEHSVIVSQVGISGSTEIGNCSTLAGQVGVAGHLKIGNNVTIAAKSGVTNDIPDGAIYGGFPAIDIKMWRKQVATLNIMTKNRRKN